jgi:hypothetical protein
MKTLVQYQHELDQLNSQGSPSPELVSEIERELQLDIHALQMQFNGRAAASINQSAKKSGKERAENQKRLDDEKTRKIQPYLDLLAKIQQMGASKKQTN